MLDDFFSFTGTGGVVYWMVKEKQNIWACAKQGDYPVPERNARYELHHIQDELARRNWKNYKPLPDLKRRHEHIQRMKNYAKNPA